MTQKIIRGPTHAVEVWGDFACFGSPAEGKVERFSYPCPTPSAARGMFDAIYFKPEFYWQVRKIELLTEPSYVALRRNEVGSVVSVTNVRKWMRGTVAPMPLLADDPSQRQQRQTMALCKPKFRLHGCIIPRPGHEHKQAAFDAQFVRRASEGKCLMQPYLGMREFVAFFRHIDSFDGEGQPVPYSQKLGWMLYDVFNLQDLGDCHAKPFISMFDAEINNGVLEVPAFESDLVRKPMITERREC